MKQIDTNKTGTIEIDDFKIAWQRRILTKQKDYINQVFSC